MTIDIRGYKIEVMYTAAAPQLVNRKAIVGKIITNNSFKIKYSDKVEGDLVTIFDDGRIVKYLSSDSAMYYEIDDKIDTEFVISVMNKIFDSKVAGVEKSREATIRYIRSFN